MESSAIIEDPYAKRRVKLFTAILFLILLAIFHFSIRGITPKAPSRFDLWLSHIEERYRKGEITEADFPTVTLKMNGLPVPKHWVVTGLHRGDRVLRLLQLARESGLMSDRSLLPGDVAPDSPVSLQISDPSNTFVVSFSEKDTHDNNPAQVMLKLFEVYSAANVMNSVAEVRSQE